MPFSYTMFNFHLFPFSVVSFLLLLGEKYVEKRKHHTLHRTNSIQVSHSLFGDFLKCWVSSHTALPSLQKGPVCGTSLNPSGILCSQQGLTNSFLKRLWDHSGARGYLVKVLVLCKGHHAIWRRDIRVRKQNTKYVQVVFCWVHKTISRSQVRSN